MLFNSLQYIAFLGIVYVIYWLLPNRFRWGMLLVVSYYFYMCWNVKYVFLIAFTTLVSYVAAIMIELAATNKKKKIIMGLAAALCLLLLFLFKYFNFLSENIAAMISFFTTDVSPITLKLLLPVGISFYTFQTLSYVIDVYRGEIPAERNLGIYATYISFFPQLVAGPIERTNHLLPQIKGEHYFSEEKTTEGLKLMLWGYFKKLVIADNLAQYVDTVYGYLPGYKGIDLVLAIFFFTIQIYCDFSGYSDIAIGTAKLLDINLMTNFKSPYFSSSVKEFWTRWHISLSQWFRDYVYIPLGGNRCSKSKRIRNLLITFLVSGLWHGANWTFVIWGAIHGVIQLLEKGLSKLFSRPKHTKLWRVVNTLAVFVFCNIAWVFFRAESIQDAGYILLNVFNGIDTPGRYLQSILISQIDLLIVMLLIIMLALYDFIDYNTGFDEWISRKNRIVTWLFYVLVGAMIVIFSKKGISAEFVYFQF